MSLLKTGVFLASRFEEFSELRQQLKSMIANHRQGQLAPIDLNDGSVSHRPPLTECLSYVRRSEFMILLLGDSYGSFAPKSDRSFTHLEYEEAIKEGTATRVLVFCIGEHYRDRRIRYAEDSHLANWQRQVEENHTLGFFDPDTPVETMAKGIFDSLLSALYEMSLGEKSASNDDDVPDELFGDIEDETLFDESEVRSLDERTNSEFSLVDDRSRFNNELAALTQPAAVAALEQREEAQNALDIGEYGVAIGHLKRALQLKPLELISNYWLAQLYVVLDRKEKSSEAMELAIRAARIALRDRLPYRAAAAYAIGARAALLANKPDEALDLARQAIDASPRYARAHIELARQHVLRGEISNANEAVRQAFSLFPRSIREIYSDPIFRPLRNDTNALVANEKSKLAKAISDLMRSEQEIAIQAGSATSDINLEDKSYSELVRLGRQSVRRQFDLVCQLLSDAEEKYGVLHAEPPKQPPTTKAVLNLNHPGKVLIVEWHKQPGDVIENEDAVFSFQLAGRSSIRQWTFRTRTPVRMTARVGDDGTWISDENPYTFEHVPASYVAQPSPRGHVLRSAISTAEGRFDSAKETMRDLQERKTQAHDAVKRANHNGMKKPGHWWIATSLVLAILCAWALSKGHGLATVLGVIAFVMLKYGLDQKSKHNEIFDQLQTNLRQVSAESEDADKAYTEQDKNLNSLRDELRQLEISAYVSKERARKMLALFEGTGLRYGRLAPFSSIYNAKMGDVIRASYKQLEDFNNQSEKKAVILDNTPGWFPNDLTRSTARLFFVASSSAQQIEISRHLAYAPHSKSLNQ